MVLLEFSMSPLSKGESVSQYVARSVEIIDQSGLDYRLHAMGTIVEGDIDQVLDVLKQCYEAMAADCDRIDRFAWVHVAESASGALTRRLEGQSRVRHCDVVRAFSRDLASVGAYGATSDAT